MRVIARSKIAARQMGSQFLPRGIKMPRRALWAFQYCKNSDVSFQVLASCEKVNLGQNAVFCSIWTQHGRPKRPFWAQKNAPFPG